VKTCEKIRFNFINKDCLDSVIIVAITTETIRIVGQSFDRNFPFERSIILHDFYRLSRRVVLAPDCLERGVAVLHAGLSLGRGDFVDKLDSQMILK
jgi:hypothetical protein